MEMHWAEEYAFWGSCWLATSKMADRTASLLSAKLTIPIVLTPAKAHVRDARLHTNG